MEIGEAFMGRGLNSMTVLLAAHDPACRAKLKQVLADQRTLHIVGEANDGAEAVKLARELRPDLILIDLCMPRMDGIEATDLIKKAHPTARVIGLSNHESTIARLNFVKAGAVTCLSKENLNEDLDLWIR